MDLISVSALVISLITSIGSCIVGLHIKRLKSGCFTCETVEQKIERVLSERESRNSNNNSLNHTNI